MTISVLFRCPRLLNRGVRLIKVSFEENKGSKFGNFGYCPLNTGFTARSYITRGGDHIVLALGHNVLEFAGAWTIKA